MRTPDSTADDDSQFKRDIDDIIQTVDHAIVTINQLRAEQNMLISALTILLQALDAYRLLDAHRWAMNVPGIEDADAQLEDARQTARAVLAEMQS